MKQFIVLGLISLLLIAVTFAGPNEIIKQKARNIRDQNNANQGVPPPQPPPPPTGAPPQSVPAVPSEPQGISQAQQQNIDKLQTDLTAIKAGSEVTPEQKQTLASDVATLAKSATKPSKTSLTKLANNLSTALADKNVSAKEQAQLAKDINIVVNSSGISPAQAQAFIVAAQKVLTDSGVTAQDVQTVGSNLKAIVGELQKSKPKLYQ
ncbi:MAG: hypothetical protein JWQ71_5010 [Pedosphaera sp.]|nr:hypothetical protein [Pedosphaera sp.]